MNINSLFNGVFSQDIAIDPGTDTTRIFVRGEGLVLKEPSYVAVDVYTNKIQAVGSAAYEMLGKEPASLKVIKPLSNGVICDFDMACKMFRHFLLLACKRTIFKPRVLTSIPSGCTDIEKKAFYDALRYAGASVVYMMEEPLCAAVGAGCDISIARGMLIADIGAGKCDVASISFARPVISRSVTVAGDTFTEEIIKYIRKNYNFDIGYLTAEEIKKQIGAAVSFELSKSMEVSGCYVGGNPGKIVVNSEEIREIFEPCLDKIAEAIVTTLEDTPPELQADIVEDGILITGGGAKLFGIDKWMRTKTGLKVFVTGEMDSCVIKGLGEKLASFDVKNNSFEKFYYSV